MSEDREAFEQRVAPEMVRCLRLIEYKIALEGSIQLGDYLDFQHFVVQLKRLPPFVGTTTFIPLRAPNGKELQPSIQWMSYTVLPKENGGLAIFSWNKWEARNPSLFAHSLMRMDRETLGTVLAKVLFELSDNVVLSPFLWLEISEPARQVIVQMHMRSIVSNESIQPPDAFLPTSAHDREFALSVDSVESL